MKKTLFCAAREPSPARSGNLRSVAAESVRSPQPTRPCCEPGTARAPLYRYMKKTACLLLVTPLIALAATEERLNKQFTVQPGGTIIVDVDFGSITISTNATSAVTVDAWRK